MHLIGIATRSKAKVPWKTMENALGTYIDEEYMLAGMFDTAKPVFKDPSLMAKETCKSLLAHWYNQQVQQEPVVFAFKMYPGKEEDQEAYPRVRKPSADDATPAPKDGKKRKRRVRESDELSPAPSLNFSLILHIALG